MIYKLFIDDIRNPVTDDWKIARSSTEATNILKEFGIPAEIAFDHDLGGEDTSIIFITNLIEHMLDNELTLPEDFKYSVHSMNSVGRANINALMNNVIKNF